MLDAWLAVHGDNLYPCREEKERLAKDMSMTYMQVIYIRTFLFRSFSRLYCFIAQLREVIMSYRCMN